MRFQEDSIPMLISRRHNLLADEMGLGKTIQAITLINTMGFKSVLIVCRASIKTNWERKLVEWMTTHLNIQVINKKTDRIEPLTQVVIINYDIVHHSYMFYQLKRIKFDLLICDEAHYLKNMETKRTQAILAKGALIHNCERSLMMTGTPVLNRPSELYPMLKVLAPTVIAPYSDYWSYARRYCDAWQDGFGFNDKGASNTAELNTKLRAHYMIRRTWNDVEVQLPKRRYEMVFIDQTADVRKSLEVLSNAERRDFKHQKLNLDVGGLATLRRETAEKKVTACIDQVKEYVESSGKLIIFAYHHSVIERLKNELSDYQPVVLTGSTATGNRQSIVDEFIKNPKRQVFLGQIQAAGEGIDGLQLVCHNILFIETSWIPAEISQAIARLWRLGQERSVLVRFLIWANSVEEHMMRVALDKVKTIRELTK